MTVIIDNAAGTSELFRELNDAVEALAGNRVVCLNAHVNPSAVPPGAIVYNQENVPLQVPTSMFAGRELWDFSERNCEAWRAAGREVTHVPVGYHPSMERFTMLPWEERDVDVVFTGLLNDRRRAVLMELENRGFVVEWLGPGIYGEERDALLARSKLAIAPLFYPGGVYGTIRAAHCAANKVPLISETAADMPGWIGHTCTYDELVDRVVNSLQVPDVVRSGTERVYRLFKATPMVLPEPKPKRAAWLMLREKPTAEWDLEAMYSEARGGPVSEEPCVRIVVPSHRETYDTYLKTETSRRAVIEDLVNNDVTVERASIDGDSLVTRMRQRAVHWMLKSNATHLLWWDMDIEALDPTCVRKMLETGHDVIAGACPFRDGTGRTVHNLWPGTYERWEADGVAMHKGCVEVMDAGTGFMLVSRKALIQLQQAHPELLHWSRGKEDYGEPMWSLFESGIAEEPTTGDAVSKSEDYNFCRLWQGLGGKVHVYAPARFRHYGLHGFEGSFLEQYGMQPKVA